MIDKKTEETIRCAVTAEMEAAIKIHGEFHSNHEAWAVLREEVQELLECFPGFKTGMDDYMEALWKSVRKDGTMLEDNDFDSIYTIHDLAEELAKEAVQVMAMCRKWLKLIAMEREEDE